MIGDVRVVAHGREAGEALAEAVAAAKTDGPLTPVTVVVPSNFVGLSARRLLGGGLIGEGGIANVQFVTPFRLAELLSADLLHDRRPITNPVLGAAVRRALADDPGPLAEVAQHHATEAALAALYAELSHVSEASLEALDAAGGSAALAVRLFRNISAHLEAFHGEDDVARAAAGRPDLVAVLASFGHIVWYLPEPVTPALGQLLRGVLDAARSSVIVALTGAAGADEPVLAACRRSGVDVPAAAIEQAVPPVGSHIVSVTDADEEVRAVVRRIVALAESGVRLDRIGVFHPLPDPYVRTLEQQLAAAGIPANGPKRERLLDSVAGRTLIHALALPAERWRRDRVMSLVSDAPVRHGDKRTFPGALEELSRQAGVVQDLSDWRTKLAGLQAGVDAQLAELATLDPVETERWVAHLERDRDDVGALAAFVDDLARGVQAIESARGWQAKSEASLELLHQLLGAENRHQRWPDDEQDAAARVEDALTRLGALDELEPDPSGEVFRRALIAELDVARGRVGRFGEGVVYGPLVSSIGHDLDAVFVLGMAEGQCPSPRRDDALLPDRARAHAVDGELPLWASKMPDQHRAFLAALAAAPPGQRYLLYPRGDLRGGRHRLPSRWLLDTASALAGETVYSTDFRDLRDPVVDVVASYNGGLRSAPSQASLLDHDLASLRDHVDAGGAAADHPAAAGLRRGLECLAARRSEHFTEWDGNLAGHPVPSPASGNVLSPTGLERWATCGYRYFLSNVLGLRERDEPERVVDLDARDRGSGVHRVLELFFKEVIAEGAPEPDAPWTEIHRARLVEITNEVFAEFEHRGRTGRPVHWQMERERLLVLLDDFLTHDDRHRATTRSRPARAEFDFGMRDGAPVVIETRDGRSIRFRGSADRVDITNDGHYFVSDYKTGKGAGYEKIDEGDPVRGGTTLQLGLYSEAAVQLLGAGGASAHYWIVDERSRFARHGYAWEGARRDRLVDVVTAIIDGIEAGVFAAVPGDWDSWRNTHSNCVYCEYDELCPRDRGEFFDTKVAAPALRVRDVLMPISEDEL